MPIKATLTLTGMLGVPATTQQVSVIGITQETLALNGTTQGDLTIAGTDGGALSIAAALPLTPLTGG